MATILVLAEQHGGKLTRATLSAVTAARQLAQIVGGGFDIALAGTGLDAVAAALTPYGAGAVHQLEHEALAGYTAQVSERANVAVTKADADRAAIDKGLAEAESAIQQQIAQLQAELASFQADASQERARIDAELQAVRESVASEAARVQAEIVRLGRVRTFLEPMVPGAGQR